MICSVKRLLPSVDVCQGYAKCERAVGLWPVGVPRQTFMTRCSSLCAIVKEEQQLSRRPLNCLLNVRITSSFSSQGSRNTILLYDYMQNPR